MRESSYGSAKRPRYFSANMRISIIDETLDSCEKHIADTGASGTEIEALLTRAVLVLTCSTFEERIEQMIACRADRLNDPAMGAFFRSCVSAVFRSTKCSEIAGLMNRFGPGFKQCFLDRTIGNERAVTFYDNIVINRHGAVHTRNLNVTLRELRQFYEEGHTVLDFLAAAINDTYPR
jgi:hypothetical protein